MSRNNGEANRPRPLRMPISDIDFSCRNSNRTYLARPPGTTRAGAKGRRAPLAVIGPARLKLNPEMGWSARGKESSGRSELCGADLAAIDREQRVEHFAR